MKHLELTLKQFQELLNVEHTYKTLDRIRIMDLEFIIENYGDAKADFRYCHNILKEPLKSLEYVDNKLKTK